jgi:hypothetical protein
MFRGPYRKRCTIHETEFAKCETGEEMRELENKRLLLNGIRRDKPIEVEYDWLTDTWCYSQLIRA